MNTAARPLRAIDYLLLLVSAFVVGFAFLKSPGLGDDFTYWRIAWSIHEQGIEGWSPSSFHNLRWPIWGFIWVLQAVFGPGLASYYFVPYAYLGLGGIVAYTAGGKLLSSRAGGWACAIAFFFHPLIDSVVFRPMPDMAEGAFIGLAVLCWLALIEADSRRKRLFYAIAAGVIAAVAFSNRFTGIFVFGILGAVAAVSLLNTDRLKWKEALLWLGVIGGTALALFCVEGLIYKQLTGEFFQTIYANMEAKGRRGTDSVNVFTLPFRFIDSLSGRGFISPFYLTLTVLGAIVASWKGGLRGRVITVWAVVLYLAYACALQSFFPPRPLLRDADRFLCSLAIPFSILAVYGINFILSLIRPLYEQMKKHPFIVATIGILLLGLATRRPYYNPGYPPLLKAHIEQLPDNTTIFTHNSMRAAAYLVAPEKAARLNWIHKHSILHRSRGMEDKALEADEFWFCRKLTWLSDRQGIRRDQIHEQDPLANYFLEPQKNWQLVDVIGVGGVPELVLYRKRPASAPVPELVEGETLFPEFPPFPYTWEGKGDFSRTHSMAVPEVLRGKPVAIQFEGSADFVQAIRTRVTFFKGEEEIEEVSMRPYFHRTDGVDFHHLSIPKEADRMEVTLRVHEDASKITINHLYFLVE